MKNAFKLFTNSLFRQVSLHTLKRQYAQELCKVFSEAYEHLGAWCYSFYFPLSNRFHVHICSFKITSNKDTLFLGKTKNLCQKRND